MNNSRLDMATFRSTAGRVAAALGDDWDAQRAIRDATTGPTPDVMVTTLHGPDNLVLSLTVTALMPGRWWVSGRLTRDERLPLDTGPQGQVPADLTVDDLPETALAAGNDAPDSDVDRIGTEEAAARRIAAAIAADYLPDWTTYLAPIRAAVTSITDRLATRRAGVIAIGEQVIATLGNDRASWKQARGAPPGDPDRDTVRFKLSDDVLGWVRIDGVGIDQGIQPRIHVDLRCRADLIPAFIGWLAEHQPD